MSANGIVFLGVTAVLFCLVLLKMHLDLAHLKAVTKDLQETAVCKRKNKCRVNLEATKLQPKEQAK